MSTTCVRPPEVYLSTHLSNQACKRLVAGAEGLGVAAKKSSGSIGYEPPTRGILSVLPASWIPYAELGRVQNPIAIFNYFTPFWFGSLYAVWVIHVPLTVLLYRCAVMLVASWWIRCAGCGWNDIIDRDLDRCVERCKKRPLARGALSVPEALAFTIGNLILFHFTLSLACARHWRYTIPSLTLATIYPFAKRYTNHPQLILGITLSWSTLIGSSAMGVDPLSEQVTAEYKKGIAALVGSFCIWAIIHDTIYACQDYRDDVKSGVLSMAVRYQGYLRTLLALLACLQVLLLFCAGAALNCSLIYHSLAAAGTAILIARMLYKVDLQDPLDCAWWFRHAPVAFTLLVAAGLSVEYAMRCAPI